jgi:hypothetical protein
MALKWARSVGYHKQNLKVKGSDEKDVAAGELHGN